MSTVTLDVDLQVIGCCVCGITFAMPTTFDKKRRESRESFYCPNGHSLSYNSNWDAEKAKREAKELREKLEHQKRAAKHWRERAREEIEEREHAERSAAAYKGHLTRTKRRVANGVCPCCNRHFFNLEQHMTTEHPSYRIEDPEE